MAHGLVRHCIIYQRISNNLSPWDLQSQDTELKNWVLRQSPHDHSKITWITDTYTGSSRYRPGIDRLRYMLENGKVKTLVLWRLDRLGMVPNALCDLLKLLKMHQVKVISLKDQLDMDVNGDVIINALQAVIIYAFETKVRNIKNPCKSRRTRKKLRMTEKRIEMIRQLYDEDMPLARIAAKMGMKVRDIYSCLDSLGWPTPREKKARAKASAPATPPNQPLHRRKLCPAPVVPDISPDRQVSPPQCACSPNA